MECFIVNESDIDLSSKSLVLTGDEARHAVRVLRISKGELLLATTLNGVCYKARCTKSGQVSKNTWLCECSIEEILPEHNEPSIDIQLVQGIPQQQSKLEEIAEKVTEIGIRSVSPIYSKRTEKKTINAERLLRIIQTACKQSHRARSPELREVTNFEKALAIAHEEGRTIIVLHESAPLEDKLSDVLKTESGHKIALFIGPEGGFDEAEIMLASQKYDARIASLGPRRLRAETAAVVAVSLALGA